MSFVLFVSFVAKIRCCVSQEFGHKGHEEHKAPKENNVMGYAKIPVETKDLEATFVHQDVEPRSSFGFRH